MKPWAWCCWRASVFACGEEEEGVLVTWTQRLTDAALASGTKAAELVQELAAIASLSRLLCT